MKRKAKKRYSGAANSLYRTAQVKFEEASFWSTEGLKGKQNCDHALKELVSGSTLYGEAQAIDRDDSGVKELRDRAFYDVQRKCLR